MSDNRLWWSAEAHELYLRSVRLEAELSVAAAVLELWQKDRQSEVAAELLPKWRGLIAETPAEQERKAAPFAGRAAVELMEAEARR